MMYKVQTTKKIDKILDKLRAKNPKLIATLTKKVDEIRNSPQHYKNLRKPLQHLKRVHINSHFVLLFSVNEKEQAITLEDFDHNNNIYD